QEALNNIARHAGASRVEIELRHEADAVKLSIRDDGCGFDPEHIPLDHFGLSIMRERAEAGGVLLSIASQPGQGTTIAIRWMITPEQELFSS
ncbi:MAG: histidine kinase, partial [Ardenticatenales bacterium]|nr:histidine kinase [Ardenticatenales bacterium]